MKKAEILLKKWVIGINYKNKQNDTRRKKQT